MKKAILFYILLCTIFFFNACIRKHDCSDKNRYLFSDEDLKWVTLVDTAPSFKITSRYSGFHVDTVKVSYDFSHEEGTETTEWCGNILYLNYNLDIYFPLYNGRSMSAHFKLENNRKGGGMQVYFGTDEYLNGDTKLDTALINGKIYYDVYKNRAGNYYAKGIGWIYFKNNQNETAELIPSN